MAFVYLPFDLCYEGPWSHACTGMKTSWPSHASTRPTVHDPGGEEVQQEVGGGVGEWVVWGDEEAQWWIWKDLIQGTW